MLTIVILISADEPVLSPSGLPQAPTAIHAPTQVDDEFNARSYRHENGRQYYDPYLGEWAAGASTGREPAVEKLRKSVVAAEAVSKSPRDNTHTRGIVIAHGTSALGLVELKEKAKATSCPTELADMPEHFELERAHSSLHAEKSELNKRSEADAHLSVSMDALRCKSDSAVIPWHESAPANEATSKLPHIEPNHASMAVGDYGGKSNPENQPAIDSVNAPPPAIFPPSA